MKRIISFLAGLLTCGAAVAAVDGINMEIPSLATNAAQQVITNSLPISGKVLAVEIDNPTGDTNVIAVTTAADQGSSISGAKTLLSSATYTADLSTNLAATLYLVMDKIVVTVSNASSTASQPKVMVIFDRDN